MPSPHIEFNKLLFNPRAIRKNLFENLKTNYTFEDQKSVIKHLPKSYLTFITRGCIVKDIKDLGNNDNSVKYDYEILLNWYCHQIMQHSSLINSFLSQRKKFENDFLLGRYSESMSALDSIASSSQSLWSIENQFLQVQFEKGLEFNFQLLNSYQNLGIRDRAFYFLAHFFSFKVEEDISYFGYETSLKSSYSGIPMHYVNFFNYRLNTITQNIGNLEELLSVYNRYPIIDKYLLIRDVFADFAKKDKENTKRELALERSKYLITEINDELLNKIIYYVDSNSAIKDFPASQKSEIIDLYTLGKYEDVIVEARDFLKINADDFSILEVYVKAHIYLNVELNQISNNSCFLNNISHSLFLYLKKEKDPNEAFVDLLSQANSISGFDFSKQLISFLQQNMLIDDSDREPTAYFYSMDYNPLHHNCFSTYTEKSNFLQMYKSVTADFFTSIFSNEELGEIEDIIPNYRYSYYKGIYYYEQGRFDDCRNTLHPLVGTCKHVGFLYENIVNILFKCYVDLSDLDSAIDLYVSTLLYNEELVSRIDTKTAIKFIEEQSYKNVKHENINFPIFISQSAAEIHSKYIAYDLYMRSLNAKRPTELLKIIEKFGAAEFLFLRVVANAKIISRKVLVFKNSLEVIKERIEICQALSKLDNNYISEYTKEISELTKRMTVQQRIKQIDQSMIYVDENGLISHEMGDINKSFNRFRTISELMNHNKIDPKGISYDALLDLIVGNIDTNTYKKSTRKTDLHFELFVQLFVQVRDKFLFSNYYGLDYYISQRIRHGTIIGQIRKLFQELNLVTSKSSEEGQYLPNEFWSVTELKLDDEIRELFENRMSEFSKTIDTLITDLKDKFIQIKTEDPKTVQTGWFNYMYIPAWHKDYLYSFFNKKISLITDFNEFIDSIFDILWDMTSQNLKKIRAGIDESVKGTLIEYLDELETDLSSILTRNQSGKIMKSIADCRTNVQSGVDIVGRWFNRSKNDEIDFTLADAFNTSLQIVNNINSPFVIKFNECLESLTLFKGLFFTHFVDLLKIFITNTFNYYKGNQLLSQTADVTFNLQEEILLIDFVSTLSDIDISNDVLANKIDEIKYGLLSANYSSLRGEGKSGFYKANNIIKNAFRDKSNEIVLELRENKFVVKIIISTKNLIV